MWYTHHTPEMCSHSSCLPSLSKLDLKGFLNHNNNDGKQLLKLWMLPMSAGVVNCQNLIMHISDVEATHAYKAVLELSRLMRNDSAIHLGTQRLPSWFLPTPFICNRKTAHRRGIKIPETSERRQLVCVCVLVWSEAPTSVSLSVCVCVWSSPAPGDRRGWRVTLAAPWCWAERSPAEERAGETRGRAAAHSRSARRDVTGTAWPRRGGEITHLLEKKSRIYTLSFSGSSSRQPLGSLSRHHENWLRSGPDSSSSFWHILGEISLSFLVLCRGVVRDAGLSKQKHIE